MREEDIKRLLLASRTERNQPDPNMVPGWDYEHLSRVIVYCYESGLVRALEATSMQSPHREFAVLGITAAGEDWLEARSSLKRVGARALLGWQAIAGILAVVGTAVTIWQVSAVRAAITSLLARVRH